jgi:hypothetical protein
MKRAIQQNEECHMTERREPHNRMKRSGRAQKRVNERERLGYKREMGGYMGASRV